MTPEEFRQARKAFGLSSRQLALVLGYKYGNAVRQFETTGTSHRQPPRQTALLMQAYLDGYRPKDWPERGRGSKNNRS